MANKHRPSKARAPYRKYVAGEGFSRVSFQKSSPRTKSSKPEVFRTPQGVYYYDESTESIVLLDTTDGDNNIVDNADSIVETKNNNGEELVQFTNMKLPWELQMMVIQHLADHLAADDERLDSNLSLVCKTWYFLLRPFIYHRPQLSPRNFNSFVKTIIENKNKKLGENVVNLDLSPILQSGKNSYISKLLKRCSKTLEQFVAPQTAFGYAPLISLRSCHNLIYLDLGLVSETVKLKELFLAIKNFKNLTHLSFPRSSVDCSGFEEFSWPKNLKYLKLSGGITNEFVQKTIWPNTIDCLELSYCPQLSEYSIYALLSQIGDNLKNLYFHYPLPSLSDNSLDQIFCYCYNLKILQISIDYCTKWLFSDNYLYHLPNSRPLNKLILESSGSLGLGKKLHPDDLTIAIGEGRLPNLKIVQISNKINWDIQSDDVDDLVSVLEEQDGSLYSI